MPIDSLVESVSLYSERNPLLHAYVAPFVVLYAMVFHFWVNTYGFSDHFEAGCIAMAVVGLLQVISVLLCHWFVSVKCLFTYSKVLSK